MVPGFSVYETFHVMRFQTYFPENFLKCRVLPSKSYSKYSSEGFYIFNGISFVVFLHLLNVIIVVLKVLRTVSQEFIECFKKYQLTQ